MRYYIIAENPEQAFICRDHCLLSLFTRFNYSFEINTFPASTKVIDTIIVKDIDRIRGIGSAIIIFYGDWHRREDAQEIGEQ